jgi:hypothetical protein
MGWRIELDERVTKILEHSGEVACLSARSSAGASAWCRRLKFGALGIERIWEEPLAAGELGSTTTTLRWELDPGLYEVQIMAKQGAARQYVVFGAQGKPTHHAGLEAAWGAAQEAGAVVLPPASALWGLVRSLGAQGRLRHARERVIAALPAGELREQLERYCDDLRRSLPDGLEQDFALGELQGTEKQLRWARSNRARYLAAYNRVKQAWRLLDAAGWEEPARAAEAPQRAALPQLAKLLRDEVRSYIWITEQGGLKKMAAWEAYADELEDACGERMDEEDEAGPSAASDERGEPEAQAYDMLELLRGQRKALGVTQRDLGPRIKLSANAVTLIERGERGLTHDQLCDWTRALYFCVAIEIDDGRCSTEYPVPHSAALYRSLEHLRQQAEMSEEALERRLGQPAGWLKGLWREIEGGAQVSVVLAQRWTRALGHRYRVHDASLPNELWGDD